MQLILSILLAIMPVHADTGAEECTEYGTVEGGITSQTVVAGDPKITFRVADPTCGAVEDCVWTIVGGNANQRAGSWYECGQDAPNEAAEPHTIEINGETTDGVKVSSENGEVCFKPAETLYQCSSFPFWITLECPDGADDLVFAADAIEIVDQSLDCTVDASVTGGGCISAQGSGVVTASVWLLFPFFGIGAWIRRRDD